MSDGLPKAKWLQVRRTQTYRRRPLYARVANASVLYWLGLEIVWRRAWLPEAIRARTARRVPTLNEEFAGYGGCSYCGCQECLKGPEGGMSMMIKCRGCGHKFTLEPGRIADYEPSP